VNDLIGRTVRVQLNGTNPLSLAEVEVYGSDAETQTFTPDPNKTYYLDVPVHNLRLAATGESEDAYTTCSTDTGADVEWKFVAKGNGSWHIQRAAGGSTPRLRTDNSSLADMQATSSSGRYTYYELSEGASAGTYYLTLPDGPTAYQRLQMTPQGEMKFVPISSTGDWLSWTITEVNSSSKVVHIRKRNDLDFAIDGGRGAANNQNLYLWSQNSNNVNQQWIELDHGNGFYSYQKMGTNHCIDGGNGGALEQNVRLWECDCQDQNQQWKKENVGSGFIKLIKRNAATFAIDGSDGGARGQNIDMWTAASSSQNLHWLIETIPSATTAGDAAPTNANSISCADRV